MATSIRLGRFTGIEVRLHFTLLLLLGLIPLLQREAPLHSALLVFSIFLCVVLHELAHAAVAQFHQIQTLSVMVYFLGGVARLARRPQSREEIQIALAGPATNFLIALLLFAAESLLGAHALLSEVMLANLWLGGINLIPAFPLDGGRALRAALAFRMPELAATHWASRTGRTVAVILALGGLWFAQWLPVAAAIFVFLASRKEYHDLKSIVLMQGAIVREVMMERFESLDHSSSLREAAEKLLTSAQQDFPVLHAGEVVGLLSREHLMDALSTDGPDAYVAGAMDRDFLALAPDSSLPSIVGSLAENDYRALVLQQGRLLGIVTLDKLNEFLVLRSLGLRRSLA